MFMYTNNAISLYDNLYVLAKMLKVIFLIFVPPGGGVLTGVLFALALLGEVVGVINGFFPFFLAKVFYPAWPYKL